MTFRPLKEILYYLPVVFLTLGLAPNITESGSLKALISFGLLMPSLLGFARDLNFRKSWQLVIVVLLLTLTVWYNRDLSSVTSLIVGSTIVVLLSGRRPGITSEILISMTLFAGTYLSVNEYGWAQLLLPKMFLPIATAALFPFVYRSKSNFKYGFILFFIAFVSVAFSRNTEAFLLWLAIPFLWVLISRNVETLKRVSDGVTGFLLVAYFIYYLLFATHLYQALTGGL